MTRNESQIFTWKYILKIASEHKKEFVFANLVSVVDALIYLPIPLILPSLINEVLLHQPGFFTKVLSYFFSKETITPVLIIFVAFGLVFFLRLFDQILSVVQTRGFKIISKDVVFRIRQALLGRLEFISIKEYETLGSGKLASYYIKDLDVIDDFLGFTVSKLVTAVLAIIGVTIVLFVINWKIALYVLLFNPLSLIFTAKFATKIKELKTKQNKAFEIFQDAFVETVDSIAQIRADNQQKNFIQRLITKAKNVKDDSIAYEWKTQIVSDFAEMILFIGVDFYYVFCMLMILFDGFSIGMMVALLSYVFQLQFYMNQIVNIQSTFYAADSALTRINQTLDLTSEPQFPTKKNPFIDSQGIKIAIQNMSFEYLPNHSILSNINLEIEPDKKIGIVGMSGCGKSTLVSALLGFYPINSGTILINDINIKDIGYDLIRQNFGVVLQQPVILNDTIRNNLTYGENISDDAIWQALNTAQLCDIVEAFDEQLDTIVGKNGVRLSGGQRQRLAIARMLLRDHKVVILDEATSSLDLKIEHALFQSIKEYLAARTTIVIAHRLSALSDADKIYVINNGIVAEQGRHEDLMRQQGIYYSLYKLQQV